MKTKVYDQNGASLWEQLNTFRGDHLTAAENNLKAIKKIMVTDETENTDVKVGWFAETKNGKTVRGKKLFFTDPDPFKTYHDEDELADERQ